MSAFRSPRRSWAHSGRNAPPRSNTPNRYSRPQVTPSSVHSGSPSKSKNRSPGLGWGSAPSGSASNTSICGSPVSRSATCNRACAFSVASVLSAMPSTDPTVVGEIGDRVDPGLDECGALGQPHVGNQHQIVLLTDVRLAGRAAQTRPNLVVVPTRGRTAGQVAVQQLLQRGPLLSVHRDQVVDRIVDNRPVAQDEPRGRRHVHTHGAQRVGVSGDLQQRRDLCAPGQFGVQHPVRDRRPRPRSRRNPRTCRRRARPGIPPPVARSNASAVAWAAA